MPCNLLEHPERWAVDDPNWAIFMEDDEVCAHFVNILTFMMLKPLICSLLVSYLFGDTETICFAILLT
jgi:hypothetical protein